MALRAEIAITQCEGPLVTHRDGSLECLELDCVDVDVDHGAIEVRCDQVFDGECPRCGPLD